MADEAAPRLLIVDQGEQYAKEYILRRLAALGYRMTLLQWNSAVWAEELFDRVIVSRLTNWGYLAETLRAEHDRAPFAGAFCYNEGALPAVDAITRLLGLPRLSRFDAESYRHKDRMRVAWEANGLPVPRYRVLYGPADARIVCTWQFPVVLKPAAIMGSRGVLRLDSYAELLEALPGALNTDMDIPFGGELWTLTEAFNIPAVALVEEYVSGPEYSAEGVVIDGHYHLIGVTEKVLTAEPFFDEVGHVFPAAGLGTDGMAEIQELLQRAHDALGMCNGLTHTEFRISTRGPVLIELNARIAGDFIPAILDEVTGLDVVSLAARVACGVRIPPEDGLDNRSWSSAAAVTFLQCPPEAYGRHLTKASRPALPEGCEEVSSAWYVEPDGVLPSPWAAGTARIGHVVFRAPDPRTAREVLHILRAGVDLLYAERAP
ncbi:ATP-grasp domain-containing protein [Plantactinospora sp. WMMC1484]|uniref:ATP-grasp domain-containing protein n=1 Tax=Plantactinospora sp. WMMC1484 TaxID=3404122 RepID=UPI003BF4DC8D